MVGAIVGSTKREPIVVGKPSPFMLENIASTLGLQRSQICMVGASFPLLPVGFCHEAFQTGSARLDDSFPPEK